MYPQLQYLGPISFAHGEVLISIFIRCHTIIVWLVVVLAVATMPAHYALHDKLNIVCDTELISYCIAGHFRVSEILE